MKKIFVVDDSELHNILLKQMLNNCGYEVSTYTDGRDLLKDLKLKKPQLIISDVDMPEMNGLELYDKIQSLSDCKDIPLIYVSSMKKEEVETKLGGMASVGFMQKPLIRETFLDIVTQRL